MKRESSATHLKQKYRQLSEQHLVKAVQNDQKFNSDQFQQINSYQGYGIRIFGCAWYFVYRLS